jgi:hypothetical protein
LPDANGARLYGLTAGHGRFHPSVVDHSPHGRETETGTIIRLYGRLLPETSERIGEAPLAKSPRAGHRVQGSSEELNRHRHASLIDPSDFVARIDPQVGRRILEHLGCWAPEPAERGPPAQAPEWPANAVIHIAPGTMTGSPSIDSSPRRPLRSANRVRSICLSFSKSGRIYPLSGAQPYADVKQLLERAAQEK